MNGPTELFRSLPPLAPSVRTVFQALYEQHPLTGQQIRERTHLPRRTVYAALQRLKGLGILHERVSLRDTRQSYFWLDVAPALAPATAPAPVPAVASPAASGSPAPAVAAA